MRVNVGIINPVTGKRPNSSRDHGYEFTIKDLANFHKLENKCVKCGTQEYLTRDHIVPYSIGGHNQKWNMLPLCNHCNSAVKGGMEPTEFYSNCDPHVRVIVEFSLFIHQEIMDFPDIYMLENKSNGRATNPCVLNDNKINKLRALWWHERHNNQ